MSWGELTCKHIYDDAEERMEMVAKVIEIEDHRRVWITGNIICKACGKEWIGVCHQDRQDKLECPLCGAYIGEIYEAT